MDESSRLPKADGAGQAADPAATSKASPSENAGGEPCWRCGYPTEMLHCKIVCRQCGFTRDCSDP
jgi:hypothetical protein